MVTSAFCNSTCANKKKIEDRRPGFRIRPRSLLLSVDVQLVGQYNAQERLVTSLTVLLRATQIAIACEDDYLL